MAEPDLVDELLSTEDATHDGASSSSNGLASFEETENKIQSEDPGSPEPVVTASRTSKHGLSDDEEDQEVKRAKQKKNELFQTGNQQSDLMAEVFGDEDDEDDNFDGFDLAAEKKEDDDDDDDEPQQSKNKGSSSRSKSRDHESNKNKKNSRRNRKGKTDSGDDSNTKTYVEGSIHAGPVKSETEFDKVAERLRKDRQRVKKPTVEDIEKRIEDLVARMNEAHKLDEELIQKGLPARHRHDLLPAVSKFLTSHEQQTELANADNEQEVDSPLTLFLGAIAEWLTPIPVEKIEGDKIKRSLVFPNLGIRTRLLNGLIASKFSSEIRLIGCLRGNQIGRAVVAISKNPREVADNRIIAQRLVHAWSRLAIEGHEGKDKQKPLPRPPPPPPKPSNTPDDDEPGDRNARQRLNDRARIPDRPIFKFYLDVDDDPSFASASSSLTRRDSGDRITQVPSVSLVKKKASQKQSRVKSMSVEGRGIK